MTITTKIEQRTSEYLTTYCPCVGVERNTGQWTDDVLCGWMGWIQSNGYELVIPFGDSDSAEYAKREIDKHFGIK